VNASQHGTQLTELFGIEISKRSMPDLQDPNCLAHFIGFIEYPIGVLALSE